MSKLFKITKLKCKVVPLNRERKEKDNPKVFE